MMVECVFYFWRYDLEGPACVAFLVDVAVYVDFLGGVDAGRFCGAGETICGFACSDGFAGAAEVGEVAC